jgi:glyoxylase-like metal-dependent hydrolase (beta-lactamase superfamily II)
LINQHTQIHQPINKSTIMEELAENIFVETSYEGVNVAAIVTKGGIICIDSPSYPRDARHWVTRLSQLNPRPIKFVILTNAHGDRILNTRWLDAPIVTHEKSAEKLNNYDKRYPQHLIDSLGQRNVMAGKELVNGPVDRAAVSYNKSISIIAGEYHIILTHNPGPSAGNSWAYIPETGILFTGDSVTVNTPPVLSDICYAEWLQSLNESINSFNVQIVVPGRGDIGDPAEVVPPMVEYLTYIEENIRRVVLEDKKREATAHVEDFLLSKFPIGDLPQEWVQKQIRNGLERVYNEIKSSIETPALV